MVSQAILNVMLSAVAAIAFAMAGWTLAEVNEQGKTDSAQAEATLALKEAATLVLQSLRAQDLRISNSEVQQARLEAETASLRRDVTRIEGRGQQ